MGPRLARAAVVVALIGAGCADADVIHGDRVDVLAATCVSIVERRHGDEFDRAALRARAGAEAIDELYQQFETRRPAAVSILLRQCRAQP